jgi:hypothetical protein
LKQNFKKAGRQYEIQHTHADFCVRAHALPRDSISSADDFHVGMVVQRTVFGPKAACSQNIRLVCSQIFASVASGKVPLKPDAHLKNV